MHDAALAAAEATAEPEIAPNSILARYYSGQVSLADDRREYGQS